MSAKALPFARVVVVLSDETDAIYLHLETSTPFPTMDYLPKATIEAEHDKGIAWVRRELHVEPEVINLRRKGTDGCSPYP